MTNYERHFTEDLAEAINQDPRLDEAARAQVMRNLASLRETRVNILITGATGAGKSSTINALFNAEKAKVGQGVDPETMDITRYEFSNIVLFDSPGLGDGKEADERHAAAIVRKLHERDARGELLIDLVLVILDGSSRDLGTSFELINKVIIPNLGGDSRRLLVAINQADQAMKGRNWDAEANAPLPALEAFLDEKAASTRRRILEATGVDVEPIYYAAGYKDEDSLQRPWNLSKVLLHILRHTRPEKRAVFVQDVNRDDRMWADDDKREDYRGEVRKTLLESVIEHAAVGRTVGGAVGSVFGPKGRVVGEAVGTAAGAVWGAVKGLFG